MADNNPFDRKPARTLGEALNERGISRRSFLKFASYTASIMALPPAAATAMAEGLAAARRQSVIWLSFQECTGCTESFTRAKAPSIEDLIFDFISLDYHHTLQNASGHLAELAREQAMEENKGEYLVIVDGSVPLKDDGIYSTIAGMTNLQMLEDTVRNAKAVISVGSCAAFGGIPGADPNPTGAVAIDRIITDKPVINLPGCPPIPEVMTGTVAYLLSFDGIPELDHLGRPKAFFGEAIHDRCYRRPFYEKGMFAKSFDDEGARQGWCLFEVGCKGPVTYNACATLKWNGGVSFPIQSGHGCLGCSEPGFWDLGGFYKPLSTGKDGVLKYAAGAAAAGVAIGAASAYAVRSRRKTIMGNATQPVATPDEKEAK
ncbi:MAG: hydrogenase small subunit [Xanthomonadales bacterium]